MKNLSTSEKALISAMLMVAILVAGLMFVIKPLKAAYTESAGALASVESLKSGQDNVIDGKAFREENIGSLIGKIENLETTYATATTHENIDIVLTTLAKKHHLTTNSFEVSLLSESTSVASQEQKAAEDAAKAAQAVKEQDKKDNGDGTGSAELEEDFETIKTDENGLMLECYTYNINGTYSNLLAFINDLNSDNKIQISTFTTTYTKGAGATDTLTIKINVKELGTDYVYAKDTIPEEYKYLNKKTDSAPAPGKPVAPAPAPETKPVETPVTPETPVAPGTGEPVALPSDKPVAPETPGTPAPAAPAPDPEKPATPAPAPDPEKPATPAPAPEKPAKPAPAPETKPVTPEIEAKSDKVIG